MRKYYFAYHNYHGMIYAVSWVEEHGICIGGRPLELIPDSVVLISEKLFNMTLGELEKIFPIPMASPPLVPLTKLKL